MQNNKLPIMCMLFLFILPCLGGCASESYESTDSYSYESIERYSYESNDSYSYENNDDYPYESNDSYAYAQPQNRRDNYRQQGGNSSSMAREVLDIVNQERRRNGADALSWDETAGQIAQLRAEELNSYFSHTRPDGSDWDSLLEQYNVRAYYWGENIAYGQENASEVMDTWMNSPGHRRNILNSEYNCMGVGCFQDDNGRFYWVQIFLRL